MKIKYDVIVVGGGHAGCEAAAASANLGSKTLLITMDMTKLAQMSCNPAMGGVAKGQIVREIDALGGYAGIVSDKSMIQFRMLNKSKGPAMWSPRTQNDRAVFSYEWRNVLENIRNLDFWQDTVIGLKIDDKHINGVETNMGITFEAKSVILTAGTFVNGLMHIGSHKMKGGRIGESASYGISEQLKEYGFEVGRMKTGTPARIDGRTIDFSGLEEQKGDTEGRKFSYLDYKIDYHKHRSCFIAHTDKNVHNTLKKGFEFSPLFKGVIDGIGPRYCPSIEDKIVTFDKKESHQLFLEPEGINTVEYYINGFSSSLPWEVQYEALRKIRGLEKVKIFRPGYAIEYDYYPPTQLKHTLETKHINNLYFAGQINGTTGYEEAGAQGMIAGINAHLSIHSNRKFVLGREQAYIGVLVDDLVSKGVDEPYRMFTSRAEYRILLRQDNADERLTRLSYDLGLASKERLQILNKKKEQIYSLTNMLERLPVSPKEINNFLNRYNTSPIKQKQKIIDIVKRPQVGLEHLLEYLSEAGLTTYAEYSKEAIESTHINIKYEGYIDREKNIADKIYRLENVSMPKNFDYDKIKSLSTEARQKLNKHQPETVGQASRISGVSPSDISVLLIFMGR